MKTPKLSVIIAHYNNGIFFENCYNSLINQTETDWEAIVVDDCSTDNSVMIIESCIKDDSRFRFYKNEKNLGCQQTVIKGVALAQAPIFARLDPDDALAPQAIEISLRTHEELTDVGLVYSNFILCDENLKPQMVHKGKQVDHFDTCYFNFEGEISHFASFKKAIYERTSGVDPFIKRAEDKDIFMKMCEVAPVKHIDEDLYFYRIHHGGASTTSNSQRALFWHWVALIKMSERRGINIEELFLDHFFQKEGRNHKEEVLDQKIARIKRSKWAKIGHKLGLFKAYKEL